MRGSKRERALEPRTYRRILIVKQFKKGLFVRQSHFTRSQREQFDLLRMVMECQREAGEKTGVLTREGVRALGHCLLGTTAMLDVLPHVGIQGAQLLRCGLFFIGEKAGWTNVTMIGHPDAPPVSQLWNAHALVRLGNLLLDTTFGQVRDTWNAAPDVAVFEMKQGAGPSIQLPGRHVVSEIARGSWNDRRGSFRASLFRLPPNVERATREWKGRPDARPERRADLVARTLELVRERRPDISLSNAAAA